MERQLEVLLGADVRLPSLIELHHMRDPGVHLFDTAYCLASSHHLLKCNRANFLSCVSVSPRLSDPPLPLSLISLLSYTCFLTHAILLSRSF